MPTHRPGYKMQKDPIRFKNLLTNAEQQLSSNGLNEPEIKSILSQAKMLQSDTKFWQHQNYAFLERFFDNLRNLI